MQAVKTLAASIKEKRIPRAEALCIPFTKGKKESNRDQEGMETYFSAQVVEQAKKKVNAAHLL
eukprot:864327-Pelagomonas_calceolata.AAC.4